MSSRTCYHRCTTPGPNHLQLGPSSCSFLQRKISTTNKTLPLIANLKRRLTLGADTSQRVRTQGHSRRHRSPCRHPLRFEHIHHPLNSLLRIATLVAIVRGKRALYLIIDFHIVLDHGTIVFHVRAKDLGSVVPGFEDDGLNIKGRGFDL